uniref:Uncharacterized protein n=1 Tax=Paenibacillus polymyxa TaxID=1406 RepID=A0AAE9PT54_PAEPO
MESVFYHLAKALETFPMEFLGEEIDLSKNIENNDFMLMQNSLMGARPKAVDWHVSDYI